ncbi:MAG TPA: isocitrate lyase/phosphoenolpyruvate mutase family protein [Anaerolineales bacterium]|nr:isocitrate lyase/phosphoenolpyruvate mutase family protein [Anaerolineales bacterium]
MMIASEQRAKAQALLSLHTSGDLLILPNVWNPIGARVLEHQGYPAIATASAAMQNPWATKTGKHQAGNNAGDSIQNLKKRECAGHCRYRSRLCGYG